MRKSLGVMAGLGGVAAAAVAVVTLPQIAGTAADHNDPPQRFSDGVDEPADIADVFAWNDGTNVNYIVTFGGPADPGNPPAYDADVLYRIHTSYDGDLSDDESIINVRFGQDAGGNWGVQTQFVPGSRNDMISGPVEQRLVDGNVSVRAGQFDDPFFFDLTGFEETTMTGDLAISNDPADDDFAGKNVTAIVIQFPRSAIPAGSTGLSVWAETRRIGS